MERIHGDMSSRIALLVVMGAAVVAVTGCVSLPDTPETFTGADKPAWALQDSQDEFIVAVSPVRRTVQIVHSSVAMAGATVDAVVNDRFRREMRETLGEYDPGAHLAEQLDRRLHAHMQPARVRALGGTAGYHSRREAEKSRLEGLRRAGHDALLDLDVRYGLFGPDAILAIKLDADLYDVETGRRVWARTLIGADTPIMAAMDFRDPTWTYTPSFSAPRFAVAEEALDHWLADGGALFREKFEEIANGLAMALVTGLELESDPEGAYWLGYSALMTRDNEDAAAYFEQGLAWNPGDYRLKNGLAVALARSNRIDEAVETARSVVEQRPEYGPAWHNLAFWYARELGDSNAAREAYEHARELGMPEERRIEWAL